MVIGVALSQMDWHYHAVALEAGAFVSAAQSRDLRDLAQWCVCSSAQAVAVNGQSYLRRPREPARTADKQLKAARLISHLHPPYRPLRGLPCPDFNWELHEFYAQLRPTFPLYAGPPAPKRVAFETHDDAAENAFCVETGDARPNWQLNHLILRRAGLDVQQLGYHDRAAVVALVAQAFVEGRTRDYGDVATGIVVVPNAPLPARPGDLEQATQRGICSYCRNPTEKCTCRADQAMTQLTRLLGDSLERN
jgi:hypothetical protein